MIQNEIQKKKIQKQNEEWNQEEKKFKEIKKIYLHRIAGIACNTKRQIKNERNEEKCKH